MIRLLSCWYRPVAPSVSIPPGGVPQSFAEMQRLSSAPPPPPRPARDTPRPELAKESPALHSDLVALQKSGILSQDDQLFLDNILDRVDQKGYRLEPEEMTRLKGVFERSLDRLSGWRGRAVDSAHQQAHEVVSARQADYEALKKDQSITDVTKKTLSIGPFTLRYGMKNTEALIKVRADLKSQLAGLKAQLVGATGSGREALEGQIEKAEAQLHFTEKAIVKRTSGRVDELKGELATGQKKLSADFAKAFVAQHGGTFTIGPKMEKLLLAMDKAHDRLAVRQRVLEEIGFRPPAPVERPVEIAPIVVEPPDSSTLEVDPSARISHGTSGKVTIADTSISFEIGRDHGRVEARHKFSQIGGTDWSAEVGGRISWDNRNEKVGDGSEFTRHVLARGLGVSASASAPVVSVGLGVSVDKNTMYIRALRRDEVVDTVISGVIRPPTEEALKTSPKAALAIRDTIVHEGTMTLSASAGVMDPHSGLKVSVSASYTNNFRRSIQRLEDAEDGSPRYKVRIEPANTKIDGKLSAGLGPFAIGGGATRATAVYYEFEMTEEALQDLVKTGQMPDIPDPSAYQDGKKKFTAETFAAFDLYNGDKGIKLLGMGTNQATTITVTASATVASASHSRGDDVTIDMTADAIEKHRGRTISNRVTAMMKGSLENTTRHVQHYRYERSEETGKVSRSYAGLTATYKITDTKTTADGLKGRLALINQLLGRGPEHAIKLPEHSFDYKTTAAAISAYLSPEHLTRLAAMPLDDDGLVAIKKAAYGAGIADPEALVALIRAMKGAADRLTPEALDADETTARQDLLAAQGKLAAAFVEAHGLGGVAVLDRLLGGGLAKFTVVSNTYSLRLEAQKIEEYVEPSRTLDAPWDEFRQLAGKRRALEELRAAVDGNPLLNTQERRETLNNIDAALEKLKIFEPRVVGSREQRAAILTGLVEGRSFLSRHFTDTRELVSGEQITKQFDDPTVKKRFLEEVIARASSREELSALMEILIEHGEGRAGVEQVFATFDRAKAMGPQQLHDLLGGIGDTKMEKLMARLTEPEKQRIMMDYVTPEDGRKLDAMMTGIEKARVGTSEQMVGFNNRLKEMLQRLPANRDIAPLHGYELVDFYKPLMRTYRELTAIAAEVKASTTLSEQDKAFLSAKAEQLDKILTAKLGGMNGLLGADQRLELLQALMDPRKLLGLIPKEKTGRASHAIIDQLLSGDKELPAQMKVYLTTLASDPGKVAEEGDRIFKILQYTAETTPSELPGMLEAVPQETLVRLVKQLEGKEREELLEVIEQAGDPVKLEAARNVDARYRELSVAIQGLETTTEGFDSHHAVLDRDLRSTRDTQRRGAISADKQVVGMREHFRSLLAALRQRGSAQARLEAHEEDSARPMGEVHSKPLKERLATLKTKLEAARDKLTTLVRGDRNELLAELVKANEADEDSATLFRSLAELAVKDPEELIRAAITAMGAAPRHPEVALGLLRAVPAEALRGVIKEIPREQLVTLSKTLSPTARAELATLVGKADAGKADAVMSVRTEYKTAAESLATLGGEIEARTLPEGFLEMDADAQAFELRRVVREQRGKVEGWTVRLAALKQEIQTLGEPYRSAQQERLTDLTDALSAGISEIRNLSDTETKSLFSALVNPKRGSVGDASRELIDALIARAAGKPALLAHYVEVLARSKHPATEGPRMLAILDAASPSGRSALLAAVPTAQLSTLASNLGTNGPRLLALAAANRSGEEAEGIRRLDARYKVTAEKLDKFAANPVKIKGIDKIRTLAPAKLEQFKTKVRAELEKRRLELEALGTGITGDAQLQTDYPPLLQARLRKVSDELRQQREGFETLFTSA